MRNHTIVVGYGTKGRTAVAAMVGDEVAPADIVVVDEDPAALERAKSAGLVTVRGSATDSEVLRLASAQHAKAIIVATNRDDAAVLVTLTARELAPNAKIIAAVREAENQHLLRAVRRGLDRGDVRDRGPAAGHSGADPERCRDDGRPADARRRVRASPNARSSPRRSAARRGTTPTSCSASCAAGSCCASTTRRSTRSSSATGCCTSAARKPSDERRLTSFQLRNVPLLSRVGADRADTLRTDIDAAVAGWADAAAAAGRFAQSGADLRRPGGARQGRRAGGQAHRARRVPRPAERRQACLGGAQRAGGARGPRQPKPRCSTCAGRVTSSTMSARSWWRPRPRC